MGASLIALAESERDQNSAIRSVYRRRLSFSLFNKLITYMIKQILHKKGFILHEVPRKLCSAKGPVQNETPYYAIFA